LRTYEDTREKRTRHMARASSPCRVYIQARQNRAKKLVNDPTYARPDSQQTRDLPPQRTFAPRKNNQFCTPEKKFGAIHVRLHYATRLAAPTSATGKKHDAQHRRAKVGDFCPPGKVTHMLGSRLSSMPG